MEKRKTMAIALLAFVIGLAAYNVAGAAIEQYKTLKEGPGIFLSEDAENITISGQLQKIYEVNVGEGLTLPSVTIAYTFLKNETYYLYMSVNNPTTALRSYLLEYNGDTNFNNYSVEYILADAENLTSARVNNTILTQSLAGADNATLICEAKIVRDPLGYMRTNSQTTRGVNSMSLFYLAHVYRNPVNITSLKIRSYPTAAIGPGSRVVLYKVI